MQELLWLPLLPLFGLLRGGIAGGEWEGSRWLINMNDNLYFGFGTSQAKQPASQPAARLMQTPMAVAAYCLCLGYHRMHLRAPAGI
jgi:uncharacterized membrane protein